MGRSTSCFKIIACGGDSADKDNLQAPEVSLVNARHCSIFFELLIFSGCLMRVFIALFWFAFEDFAS